MISEKKYQHDAVAPDSLGFFLIKLSEKKQSDIQKGQTQKAIQFYHKSFRQNSFPCKDTGNNRSKEKRSSIINEATAAPSLKKRVRTEEHSNTNKQNLQRSLKGCSWVKEFQELEGAISIRHYSPKTLKSYRGYIRRFQAYTKSLDPQYLSAEHVKEFLTYLAVEKKVSASTQNLAFNSLLFFFRHVLNKEFGQIEGVVRAKKRPYIPVVLSREEINKILEAIDPQYRLIIKLLYGCGLRLFECLNLRVQCLNFDAEILTIHDGKGI